MRPVGGAAAGALMLLTLGGFAGVPTTAAEARGPTARADSEDVEVALRVLSGPGPVVAGDEVRYEVRVTAGPDAPTVPLAVGLDTPGGANCDRSRLAAGQHAVCVGRAVVSDADAAAGSVVRTASVGGVEDTVSVPTASATGLALTVSARQPADARGRVDRLVTAEVVDLDYAVTNTGDRTVTGLRVTDGLVQPGRVACARTTLAPGATTGCRAAYIVTQDDVDRAALARGRVELLGNAAARTADGSLVASPQAGVRIPTDRRRGVRVVAEVSTGAGPVVVGDTVGLRYRVRNFGEQSVRDLVLRSRAGAEPVCDRTRLVARQYTICTATHVVTADDAAAGAVLDRVMVVGRAADGARLTARAGPIAIPAVGEAGLELARSVAGTTDTEGDGVELGDTVEHVFTVTNTSGQQVTRVSVADSLLRADGVTCDRTALAPGEAAECRGTQEVTQAELDTAIRTEGSVVATANATAVAGGAITGDTVASTQQAIEVPAAQDTALRLAASVVSGAGPVVSGDVVAYELVVANVGDLTVTGLRIEDDLLSGIRCDRRALGSGRTATCRASRLVTDADVAAGSLVDRATASGTAVDGTPVAADADQTSVATSDVAGLRIETTVAAASVAGPLPVDGTVDLLHTVTNSGDAEVRDLRIAGSAFAPGQVACSTTTLPPGASTTCRGTRAIRQDELDAAAQAGGPVSLGASASGRTAGGPVSSPQSTVAVPARTAARLEIEAEVTSGPGPVVPGDVVGYRWTLTNTGDLTIRAVGIRATGVTGLSCDPLPLGAGEQATCTGLRAVTADDAARGRVAVRAFGRGVAVDGGRVRSRKVPAGVPATSGVALDLDVAVDGTSDDDGDGLALGDTVDYLYTITNTSPNRVTRLRIQGAGLPTEQVICFPTIVLPGEVSRCRGTRVVTADDLELAATDGGVVERATASGSTSGLVVASPQDSARVGVERDAGLDLTTTVVTGDGPVVTGDVVRYLFTVADTGEQPVTDVDVEAPLLADVTCEQRPLRVGGTLACTGSRRASPQDAAQGGVEVAAVAVGTALDGTPLRSGPSSATTPVVAGGLRLAARVTGAEGAAGEPPAEDRVPVGGWVTVDLQVTNDGADPVADVSVAGPWDDVGCAADTLEPGDTVACRATHVVTRDDVDLADIRDDDARIYATATGTTDDGPVASPHDAVEFSVDQRAALTLAARVTQGATVVAGEAVAYDFVVTNSGQITVEDVTVSDRLVGGVVCAARTLRAGERTTCRGAHPVSQDEVEAGSVVTASSAVGVGVDANPVVSPPDSTALVTSSRTGLEITTAVGATSDEEGDGVTVGDTVDYVFTIANVGDRRASDLTVADARFPDPSEVACDRSLLEPGRSLECRARYTVTQTDVDAAARGGGGLTSTALATGLSASAAITSEPARAEVAVESDAVLGLAVRVQGPEPVVAGDVLDFVATLTNRGDQSVSGTVVRDRLLGVLRCGAAVLAAGQSTPCSGRHRVSQADVDSGSVEVAATGTGTAADGSPVTSERAGSSTTASTRVGLEVRSDVAAVPDPEGDGVSVGDTVDYVYTVTNVGDVRVSGIGIDDAALLSAAECAVAGLAPGDTTRCRGAHEVTQGDVDGGAVVDTASATGTARNVAVRSPPSAARVGTESAVGLRVDERVTGVLEPVVAGDVIRYDLIVTNTGDLSIGALRVVAGGVADVACDDATLGAGASTRCIGGRLVSQTQVDGGSVGSTAYAAGRAADGRGVRSPRDATASPASTRSALELQTELVPTGDLAGDGLAVGDGYRLLYALLNSGDVTLSGVRLRSTSFPEDAQDQVVCGPVLGGASGPAGGGVPDLPPGAQVTCTVTATATQQVVDAGRVVDRTEAAGSSSGATAVSSGTVEAGYDTQDGRGLLLDASLTALDDPGGDGLSAGDVVAASLQVTNAGDRSVTGLTVEAGGMPATCPVEVLGSHEQTVCRAEREVTDADLAGGELVLAGDAAAAVAGSDAAVTAADESTSPVGGAALVLDQQVRSVLDRGDDGLGAGDLVRWTYRVTNTGDVPLTGVRVEDDLATDLACPIADLAPGRSMECRARHRVRREDERAGRLVGAGVAVAGDVRSEADPATTVVPGNGERTGQVVDTGGPDGDGHRTWWLTGGAALLLALASVLLLRRRLRVSARSAQVSPMSPRESRSPH